MNIISKIKEANLTGRGGGDYPVGQKWQIVRNMDRKSFIICNASESEPGVFKDGYILDSYPEKVIEGITIALDTFKEAEAYIYLREDYYKRFFDKLKLLIEDLPITLYKKNGGYLFGEETSIISDIEGDAPPRPRLKPPFPSEKGLLGQPTLINNVETFYNVALVNEEKYEGKRVYSISGDIKSEGICELPEKMLISQVLNQTDNYPDFDFFVQAGGGASGEIFLKEDLDHILGGYGSVVLYNKEKTDLYDLMLKWAKYFMAENCDRCTPCREGIYRLKQMLENKRRDPELLKDLFLVLKKTSFCSFGKRAVIPFESLVDKMMS